MVRRQVTRVLLFFLGPGMLAIFVGSLVGTVELTAVERFVTLVVGMLGTAGFAQAVRSGLSGR
jgi:hypothetical protein